MKTHPIRVFLSCLVVVVSAMLSVHPAMAQDDPPLRVARLSSLEGEVSFNPAGTDDWVTAVINRPIITGDKLWCDANARAELHVGSAAIRLGHRTAFSFLNLTDRMLQIRLAEGGLHLRVRRLEANEIIEIDTPNLAFSIRKPGRYRLDVNEAGDTTIIQVREGEGEVFAHGASYAVHAGQQGYFRGTDSLHSGFEAIPPPDGFDAWAELRDNREASFPARAYVSEDVIGYEDLNDDYGRWRSVPHYGHVWFPRVAVAGWAPYRFGHWAWVSPWGWTWIDDAPWGFAPFHYGRWVHVHGAWGWIPCRPRMVGGTYFKPVYSPALVAWIGGGHHGGVGVAIGAVSWFPLGPGDVYVPAYPASRHYVKNVNITNTTVNQTIINNYYNNPAAGTVSSANRNVAGAVTSVSPQSFTSAQPVSGSMLQAPPKGPRTTPATTLAPALVPPTKAVLGAGNAAGIQPPPTTITRPVVAKTPPPPATPAFTAQQTAIEGNKGRPISIPQSHQLQPHSDQQAGPPVKVLPKTPSDTPPASSTPEARQPSARPNEAAEGAKVAPSFTGRPQAAPAIPPSTPAIPPVKTRIYEDRPPAARPSSQGGETKTEPAAPFRTQSPEQPSQPGREEPPSKTPGSVDRPPSPQPAAPRAEETDKTVPPPAVRQQSVPTTPPEPGKYESPGSSRSFEDRAPVSRPPTPSVQQFEPKQPPTVVHTPQPQPMRQAPISVPVPPSKQKQQSEQDKGTNQPPFK
ncbi:MAG: DUF6600 domain-containing protein [Thermodesulfobacteriota bacterium]